MRKISLWLTGATAAIVGTIASIAVTHADTLFAVPTSTAPSLTANVGDQLGDPGTLSVIGVIAGIYLVFYVIRQLLSMVPKSHGRKS